MELCVLYATFAFHQVEIEIEKSDMNENKIEEEHSLLEKNKYALITADELTRNRQED